MKDMEHVCSRASVHVCICCEVSSSVTVTSVFSLYTISHTQLVVNWGSRDLEYCLNEMHGQVHPN